MFVHLVLFLVVNLMLVHLNHPPLLYLIKQKNGDIIPQLIKSFDLYLDFRVLFICLFFKL